MNENDKLYFITIAVLLAALLILAACVLICCPVRRRVTVDLPTEALEMTSFGRRPDSPLEEVIPEPPPVSPTPVDNQPPPPPMTQEIRQTSQRQPAELVKIPSPYKPFIDPSGPLPGPISPPTAAGKQHKTKVFPA